VAVSVSESMKENLILWEQNIISFAKYKNVASVSPDLFSISWVVRVGLKGQSGIPE
jgi:hypothetical protein